MDDHLPLSRRRLLQSAAALGAAVTVGLSSPPSALALVRTKGNVEILRRSLAGRLILPGELGFTMAAIPNNMRYADVLPIAVAMCTGTRDVQTAVDWARESRVPFAIRCGGHNYAGFSTTRGLLIDVKAMNRITVDKGVGLATVGAGASNQDMADALRSSGLAIPSGRCPTVGISGLVLGGGWGFAATHFGLTCDALTSSTLVLADGSRVTASTTDNPDLYWALRGGGGGNFGVNTSFTFQLHDVMSDVTIFNITWPAEKQVEMLLALQEMQLSHPTTMGTRTKALPDRAGAYPRRNQLQVTTIGQFFGPIDELRAALAGPLAISTPISSEIRETSYWLARDYLVTDDPKGMYDIRSSFVADRMSAEGLETMLTWMTKWPGGSLLPENMGILFAIGGKVRDRAPGDTAYVHRGANFIFESEHAWSPVDEMAVIKAQTRWLNNYRVAMTPYVLPQSYVNFPSRVLKNWKSAYYGSNLPRLSRIKRAYDPDNVFTFEQSIPLP